MGFKLPGKSIQTGTSGHSSALKMVAEQKAASALKQKAKTYADAYKDLKYKSDKADSDYTKVDKYGREYGGVDDGSDAAGQTEFTKAAKAWNMKTYGTHNPTADAKKGSMTKKELAAKYKASQTAEVETPKVETPKVETPKVEEKPRVEKKVDSFKEKVVYRKDGSVKKRVKKTELQDESGKSTYKDKSTYRKGGGKKKQVTKTKDPDHFKKTKTKYDKEGVKKSKIVEKEGGRRTVTKTDKEGNVTTKSRRTLKGILTGKGKKEKVVVEKSKKEKETNI